MDYQRLYNDYVKANRDSSCDTSISLSDNHIKWLDYFIDLMVRDETCRKCIHDMYTTDMTVKDLAEKYSTTGAVVANFRTVVFYVLRIATRFFRFEFKPLEERVANKEFEAIAIQEPIYSSDEFPSGYCNKYSQALTNLGIYSVRDFVNVSQKWLIERRNIPKLVVDTLVSQLNIEESAPNKLKFVELIENASSKDEAVNILLMVLTEHDEREIVGAFCRNFL